MSNFNGSANYRQLLFLNVCKQNKSISRKERESHTEKSQKVRP